MSALMLVAQSVGEQAGGQSPPRSDSLSKDSAHVRQCEECMMIIFPIAALFLAAPSAFLSFIDSAPPTGRAEFPTNHIALYLTGGPVATQNPDLGWTYGQAIEILTHGVAADARLEQFYLFPQHLGYTSAHLGFVVASAHGLSGGMGVGYRGVRGPPVIGRQEGVEIALPLIWSRGGQWWRFESFYVANTRGTNWNYRVQGEWPFGHSRYVAGVKAETMSLPIRDRSDVAWVTLTAVVGVHR